MSVFAARQAANRERNSNEFCSTLSQNSEEGEESRFAWAQRLEDGCEPIDSTQRASLELEQTSDIAMKLLLSEIPSDSSRLVDCNLLKLDQNFEWKPFRVVTTEDHILFSKSGTQFVFDSIPLLDIVNIEKNIQEENIPCFVDYQSSEHRVDEDLLHGSTATWRRIKDQGSRVPCFEVRTREGGYNAGRSFYLKGDSEESSAEFANTLDRLKKAAEIREAGRKSWLRRLKSRALRVYQSNSCQSIVAALIAANFVVNVTQTEIQPVDGSTGQRNFAIIDNSFTGRLRLFSNNLSKYTAVLRKLL
jgi:hypothetical protein